MSGELPPFFTVAAAVSEDFELELFGALPVAGSVV